MIAAARLPLCNDPVAVGMAVTCHPYRDRLISIKRQPLADHVGIDAVTDGNAGDGYAGLHAFLNNLGFKRLGVSASLAHLKAIASA